MINVITRKHGNVLLLILDGDLNIDNTDKIENAYRENITDKPETICLNCKALNSIDSSGLGLLIKLSKDAERSSVNFVVTDMVGNVSSLMDISKLENLFPIMSTDEFNITYLT